MNGCEVMIISMVILLILVGCWINGRNKGLVAMLISTATYLVGWIFARIGAKPFGLILSNILPSIGQHEASPSGSSFSSMLTVSSNRFFYNGIAFIIIFYGITFLSRWLLKRVRFLKHIPVLGTVNGWAGGLLDMLVGYLIIFMLLMIFQLWPGEWWQEQLSDSGLAQWIILKTPILAEQAIHWFA